MLPRHRKIRERQKDSSQLLREAAACHNFINPTGREGLFAIRQSILSRSHVYDAHAAPPGGSRLVVLGRPRVWPYLDSIW